MSDDLTAASLRVRRALVEAFAPYVRARLGERDIEPSDSVATAIEMGATWLDGRLGELFAAAPAAQRSSPLALFQAALAFPTEALERDGVAPVARDEAEVATLPGDRYRLAPASSQDLGEEAWQAHVVWGVAKAKALGARPGPAEAAPPPSRVATAVALFSADAELRNDVGIVVRGAGFSLAVWRNPGALDAGLAAGRPVMAIVDLDHRTSDEALRALKQAGVPAIAVGSAVDDVVTARTRSLGAGEVLSRGRLQDRLPALLPQIT